MKNMFWPARKAYSMFILHSLAGISVTLTSSDLHQEKKQIMSLTKESTFFLEKYMVAGGHDSGGVRFLSLFLPSKNELSYLNLSP